jgi:diguanylate cyclase (GGDEF)-like protein
VIKVQGFIKESSDLVRKLLFCYWIAATLLLGFALVTLKRADDRQRMIDQSSSTAVLVESALAASSSGMDLQILIESYARMQVRRGSPGLEALFLLDSRGEIVYSSRPAYLGLMIFDNLFRSYALNDPQFRAVASCFQASRFDCIGPRSDDFVASGPVFTAFRPVYKPSSDLGLPRQPFLMVASYSKQLSLPLFLEELLPLLLMALVLAGLLSAGLGLALLGLLLPRLSLAAQTDGLTRLMNRAFFMESAMQVLAEAEVAETPLVFAILDVDHFKKINDSNGHDCGDVALVSISAVLATVMRADDLVCRFGGEEFALLLATDQESGRRVLERLRLQLEMSRVAYNGREIPITVSIGAASTSECGYNLDYLYTSADRCLYAAKHSGRNRVEWVRAESTARLRRVAPSPETTDSVQDPVRADSLDESLPEPLQDSLSQTTTATVQD